MITLNETTRSAATMTVSIKQEPVTPVTPAPRKLLEVVNTGTHDRPMYRLPFIDLLSSVKSGKLETPSDRNRRKRKKPGVVVTGSNPDVSGQSSQQVKQEDTEGTPALKKPPGLHITRQTVANFVCSTCGKVQKDNLALKRHLEVDHRNDRRFKCTKCVFQTDDTGAWNEHYLDCTIQPDYKIERRIKGEVVDSDEG